MLLTVSRLHSLLLLYNRMDNRAMRACPLYFLLAVNANADNRTCKRLGWNELRSASGLTHKMRRIIESIQHRKHIFFHSNALLSYHITVPLCNDEWLAEATRDYLCCCTHYKNVESHARLRLCKRGAEINCWLMGAVWKWTIPTAIKDSAASNNHDERQLPKI